MRQRSAHEILGIARAARRMEITIAYRKLAMYWHPDRNTNPMAKARFQEIQQAYKQLCKSDSPSKLREVWDKMVQQSGEEYKQVPHSGTWGEDFPVLTLLLLTVAVALLLSITWPGNLVAFTLGLLMADRAYKSGQSLWAVRLEAAFGLAVRLYFIALLLGGVWAMAEQVIFLVGGSYSNISFLTAQSIISSLYK